MNLLKEDITAFFSYFKDKKIPFPLSIAPQFIHLPLLLELARPMGFEIGAQNCHFEGQGAFTGEVSPKALKDLGAAFTLIGHSERRTLFHETPEMLEKKAKAAISCGLKVIYCIGENEKERESGETFKILSQQLSWVHSKDMVLAYEPVWAIGTGKAATAQIASETHDFIKDTLLKKGLDLPVLYGGSVKPDNIVELWQRPNIDGFLIGGASLKASDFHKMAESLAGLAKTGSRL
jgi:triosephosphate isomerase